MSLFTKISLLTLTLIIFLVHNCVQNNNAPKLVNIEPSSESTLADSTSSPKSFKACSEITHSVLITHCGSCHQSSLKTHKAGAIAIFDLDQGANWHMALSEENLQGIANRTENKSTISEQQKEAIAVFLELKELQLAQ